MHYAVIFTHIEKCAGSSLRRSLFNAGAAKGLAMHIPCRTGPCAKVLPRLTPEEIAALRYRRPQVVADHARYLEPNVRLDIPLATSWQITVLRDPVTRALSHFHYFSSPKPEHLREVPLSRWPEDALRAYFRVFATLYCTRMAGHFSVVDGAPVEHPRRTGQDLLDAASRALGQFDLVGIVEGMETFRRRFNRDNPLGLRLDGIPTERVGPPKDDVPAEILDLIREELAADISLYRQAVDMASA